MTIYCPPFFGRNLRACYTNATSVLSAWGSVMAHIVAVQLVPVPAMGLAVFDFSCRARPASLVSAMGIFLWRDRLKVIRIDATTMLTGTASAMGWLMAHVVDIHPFRYRPLEVLVTHAMRRDGRIGKPGVPAFIQADIAKPASVRVHGDVTHQPVDKGDSRSFIMAGGHLIFLQDRCLRAVETLARFAARSYFTPQIQEFS